MFKDAATASFLLVAFFLFGLSPYAMASSPEVQIIGEQQQEKQPYAGLEYFCTPPEETLDITSVQARADLPWQSAQRKMPNLGFTTDQCWFRFAVRNLNRLHSDWLLRVDYAMLGELDAYQLDAGGNLVGHYQAGMDRDFSVRPNNFPTPAFPMTLPTGKDSEVYLRVSSAHSIQLPLELVSHERFSQQAQNQTIVQGIFFGGMLVMAYNVWRTVRGELREETPSPATPLLAGSGGGA